MDNNMREKAAKTAVDAFIVVERIYRHSFQTLNALKEELKTQLGLIESPLRISAQSSADPKSWIYQFRGVYLANKKLSLEEYKKQETPILFLQVSLYNPSGREPILRYGIIQRIFNMRPLKGARFDDYFRMVLARMHDEPKSGELKALSCNATVHFDEKPLLDIREDKEVVALAGEISEKYAKFLLD